MDSPLSFMLKLQWGIHAASNKPPSRSDLSLKADCCFRQFKECENYFLTNPLVMVEILAFISIYFGSWHPLLTELVIKLTVCSSGTQAGVINFT